jgi:O-antigen/teichoic acid export membrane protein
VAFTRILAACVFVGLGLCVLQDEVIAVVAGPAYAASAAVIAPVLLGYFFLAAADLMDSGFYVRRRTGLKTWVALASTAVMLLLYAALIPTWGRLGAAWATAAGFACHALLTRLVAQRLFPVRYEPGRVAAMLALAAGLWLASRALPAELWALPLKAALWLLWPALLWACGLVSEREKAVIRSALAGVLRGQPRCAGEAR